MTVSKDGGTTVITLVGDLDIHSAARLRELLVDLIHDVHPDIALDLGGVPFADSTGVGTVVDAAQRARRAGGDLVLRSVTPAVQRSVEIMGLARLLGIED